MPISQTAKDQAFAGVICSGPQSRNNNDKLGFFSCQGLAEDDHLPSLS